MLCESLPVPGVSQAAARHHCSYLVQHHSAGFLEAGGEESWLSSLEHAPTKLHSLQTLNKLLAHRPWLITQQHIQVRHISRSPTHSPCLTPALISDLNPNALPQWLSRYSLCGKNLIVYPIKNTISLHQHGLWYLELSGFGWEVGVNETSDFHLIIIIFKRVHNDNISVIYLGTGKNKVGIASFYTKFIILEVWFWPHSNSSRGACTEAAVIEAVDFLSWAQSLSSAKDVVICRRVTNMTTS